MQNDVDQCLREINFKLVKMFDNQSFMVYTLTIKVKEACFGRSKSK